MEYHLRLLPTGRLRVPAPQVYWMRRFAEWVDLEFQMAVIQGPGGTVVVNTGFPPDSSRLASGWQERLGPPAVLERRAEWEPAAALQAVGVAPHTVDCVILTPLQLYATGNLRLFPNARIAVSRRGWIEDIIAPSAPRHVPRDRCIADEDLFWLLGEGRERLWLLDDVQELRPGLVCRWAGVHHRSSLLVEVATARGLAVLSDCAFHFANVEEDIPLGIAESILEAHAVYADLRRRAQHFLPLYEPRVRERYPEGIVA